jgi:hypothetical protein
MGAADDRDGVYSPEVIKELAAFLGLAPKHPQTVFDVVHLDSLHCSSARNHAAHRHSVGNHSYWRELSDALEISVNRSTTV